MECKKINSETIRKILGFDKLSPAEAAKIQAGISKQKCINCENKCGKSTEEDDG